MGKINFNLDDRKHTRFKAKACLEGTEMTKVLIKAVDAFIGKDDTEPLRTGKVNCIEDTTLEDTILEDKKEPF